MGSYIFGYGSLINPASIARTLGRPIAPPELIPATLFGYQRTWNAGDRVVTSDGRQHSAVFLNIEPTAGASCNGILIPVTHTELVAFDARERVYHRLDVSAYIEAPMPRESTVYTYCAEGAACRLDQASVVCEQYEAIIRAGFDSWPTDFRLTFEQSTPPHEFPRLRGYYTFA